jgi:hypothetical protein
MEREGKKSMYSQTSWLEIQRYLAGTIRYPLLLPLSSNCAFLLTSLLFEQLK